jgi:hypothetical protein
VTAAALCVRAFLGRVTREVLSIDIEASYLTREGKRRCVLRIADAGLGMYFGKKHGGYTWDQVRRISFDDPGRTKASVGAIALFGVLGMASRRAFTLITVSTDTEELYFENNVPIGAWRATGRRIVEDVPRAAGRIYVDGYLADTVSATPPAAWTAGWYADPLGLPGLRWHDGSAWTEHTAPAPQAPQ